MADLKISELTLAGSLTGAELVPLVQSGGNKRARLDTVSTYAREIPQTAAELAAGAPIVVASRRPGDFVRYGFDPDASATVNAAAGNAALTANSFAFCDDPGTYTVNSSLVAQSNQTLRLAEGVTIKAATTMSSTQVLNINEIENFQMEGGVLDGDKASNPAGTLFGVRMLNSHNVKLFGVSANNFPSDNVTHGAAGDGFYIGGFAGGSPGCTDIELINCRARGNVRQGLSIVRADGWLVQGGSYNETSGDNPGGGIDLEANPGLGDVRNGRIVGVELSENQTALIMTEGTFNVTVTACTMLRSREQTLLISDATNAVIVGNYIEGSGQTIDAPLIDIVGCDGLILSKNIIQGEGAASAHEGAGIRFPTAGSNIEITQNIIRNTRLQGLSLGNSALADEPTLIDFSNNMMIDCVDPGVAPTSGVISVGGNTVSGDFPLLFTCKKNIIRDTRGTPAAFGVKLTNVPAATSAGYRIEDNRVIGPTTAFDDNVSGVPPLCGVVTWNPADSVDGTGETSPNITVLGAALGDAVEVYPPYSLQGFLCSGYVSATDTVVIRIQNESGSTVNLASGSWRVRVKKLFQA